MIYRGPNTPFGRGSPAAPALCPIPMAALVGDSLTAPGYELTTATWLGGIAGGILQPVHNAGVSAETVANVLSRIDNSYTNVSPGLAGLAAAMGVSKLGWVMLRIGTNDARAGAGYSAISTNFSALMTKLAGYADRVLIMAVPPMTTPESNATAKTASAEDINTGYAAYAAANPSFCSYIDDASVLRVGGSPSGAGISTYFIDGVHTNNAGVRVMGIAGGDALASLLPALGYTYASPLVTSNSDSYQVAPATAQWSDNPAMTGAATQSGSWPGNVVTGVTVSSSGSGSGTVSIVAADGGDANQTPWQRVTPTGGQSTGWTQASISNHGRPITSVDPSRVEALVEVRFNALDVTNVRRMTFSARGNTTNNQYLLPRFWLGLGPEAATVTKTVTMRSKLPRVSGATESGITLFISLEYQTTFSGASMGSFDFRCLSLKG